MLTNFTAGHSLSDFLFNLEDFENSLFCSYLFSPQGLAIPGYVFASNMMGEHYFKSRSRGTSPLIEVGLVDGVFVPHVNRHVFENGGLTYMVKDLKKRGGKGVHRSAAEVVGSLGSLANLDLRIIPDNRNYGIETDRLIKSMVQSDLFKEDLHFSKFWEDDEVRIWRSQVIDEARENSCRPRNDGTQDQGLKIAMIVGSLATQLGLEKTIVDSESFGPEKLLLLLTDSDQESKARRFLKIVCLLFNESIAWAMQARSNWPLQDQDFFRFQLANQKSSSSSEPSWSDALVQIVEMPDLEVLRHCDSSLLREIRDIGEEVFFPCFQKWSEDGESGSQLLEQFVEYMERTKLLLKASPTIKRACMATAGQSNGLVKSLSTSLGGAAGGIVGAVGGYFTAGADLETSMLAGAAGGAIGTRVGSALNDGIQKISAEAMLNQTTMQELKFGRSMDVTILK